jgi:hypothetical protein
MLSLFVPMSKSMAKRILTVLGAVALLAVAALAVPVALWPTAEVPQPGLQHSPPSHDTSKAAHRLLAEGQAGERDRDQQQRCQREHAVVRQRRAHAGRVVDHPGGRGPLDQRLPVLERVAVLSLHAAAGGMEAADTPGTRRDAAAMRMPSEMRN